MALTDALAATAETVRGAVPTNIFSAIGQSIAALHATGIEQTAANIGAHLAVPGLVDLHGSPVQPASGLKGRPFVLIFYRGGWCPYCNVTLKAYSDIAVKIREQGAEVLAVTPELPSRAEATAESTAIAFPIYVDKGNRFARTLGLVFAVPEALRSDYRQIGIDLPEWNGDDSYELPVPAIYVVDKYGIIRWAHVAADFTTRAEPEGVLSALSVLAT
jgi:peroxiredoxin